MNPLRILLVSAVFPPQPGGSGRWMHELYRRLSAENLVVAAGEHPQQTEFDAESLDIRRIPLRFGSWGCVGRRATADYMGLMKRLRQLVKAERIEILHTACVLPEGFAAWCLSRLTGIPYLTYFHGEELQLVSGSRELTWMTRGVMRGAQLLIANSQNTARLLREQWRAPADKIRVLHPGADCSRFVPAEPSEAVRQQLGWQGRRVVLTVGRLQKRKGQDMLLRALPAIRQQVPDLLYAIVGDGEEREALERLTDELGVRAAVQFRGEPDDNELARCYQQCDLFVLPNRQVGQDIEGFGMVLVEAQACGKPVLAGASGGTAETMRIPETGVIIPCGDPRGLEQIVPELLRDLNRRASMGATARPWAVEQFDWESLCEKATEIFSEAGRSHRRLSRPPLTSAAH